LAAPIRRTLLAVLVALAALACALPGLAAAAPNYVSLGDSYTAGPLIPNQLPPLGCLKSDHNYSHLAAPSIGLPLRDPSCSGAKTADMTAPQSIDGGSNPPQFDSLATDTRVVTLGIGGNDIGFTEIIKNCGTANPFGHPCQDTYVVGGRDEISERIKAAGPKVAAVLQGIHQRSPRARVFVVNYLPVLPETGNGCWPQMPIAFADVPYLRAKQKELNAMLASRARANRARLIDAYSAGIGHDACKLPTVRYVEPLVPNTAAAPVHPNLSGMQAVSAVVAATVGRG
jgi:lysophospholipase L1-like esterase